MELPDPPQGWTLKSINEINENSWCTQLWHKEHYVYGYGTSLRYSMLDAIRRIEDGNIFDMCSGFAKTSEDKDTRQGVDKLLAEIKASRPKLDRRF